MVIDHLREDLRAFADPGSEVLVDEDEGLAIWEQDDRELRLRVYRTSGGESEVVFNEKRMKYRDFLASHHMADLNHLADFMLKAGVGSDNYVEASARTVNTDGEQGEPQPAVRIVRELASVDLPPRLTRVVFVEGDAGTGKTEVLRKLSERQAKAYQNDESDVLFFYVDAQGHSLSRLEDTMAKELDDLHAKPSYKAIAPLTRNGLVIPIVDGFDELIGSGGYDEAFSSLAAFLATLKGEGALVASARSSFFEYKDFYSNAARYANSGSLRYQLRNVKVEPWGPTEREEYINLVADELGSDAESIATGMTEVEKSLDEQNRELLQKPFYVSQTVRLLAEDALDSSTEGALLDRLVQAFMRREAGKLLDSDGRQLLSVEGHRAFLTGLAEEMWWQESRKIDVRTVQVVAEMIAEQFKVPVSVAGDLVAKVASYAFLTPSSNGRDKLQFEHEVFYGYFLAQRLCDILTEDSTDTRRFLSRSVLEETVVSELLRVVTNRELEPCDLIEGVGRALKPTISDMMSRENGGKLVAAILRELGCGKSGLDVQNLVVRREDLGDIRLKNPRFRQCEIIEARLSEVELIEPTFANTRFHYAVVDPTKTRFNGARIKIEEVVIGLEIQSFSEEWRSGRTNSPSRIARAFTEMGAEVPGYSGGEQEYSEAVLQRIEILDRFLRIAQRQYYVSYEELEERGPFRESKEWEVVLDALRGSGVVEETYIQKSGPKEPLLKLTVPPNIVRRGENPDDTSVPAEVRKFWGAMTEEG